MRARALTRHRKESGAAVEVFSPDDLHQLMIVVGAKDWIPLLGIAVLLILGLAWSVLGSVPTIVTGRGVLSRPRRIVAIESLTGGRVTGFKARTGDFISKGEIVARLDQTELRQQIEGYHRLLAELVSQDSVKTASERRQVQLREQQNQLERRASEAQRANLDRSLASAEAVALLLQKRLKTVDTLKNEGLMAEAGSEFTDVHVSYRENDTKISTYKAQREQIDGQIQSLEAQLATLQQQNLASSTTRHNEITELQTKIAAGELQLRKNEDIRSEYSGKVVEVYFADGQVIAPGARLLLLDLAGPGSNLVSISYFSIKDGRKIQPGMRVQVTPDTVERTRFGGIVAKVLSVSPLPVTREGAAATVGNVDVVQELMSPGAWVEVTAELEEDRSVPSGYRWSSAPGPRMSVSAGITTMAHVTIERRAPVSYIFPWLRDASGLY